MGGVLGAVAMGGKAMDWGEFSVDRRGQGEGSSLWAKLLHGRDGGGVGVLRRCQAIEGRLRSVVVPGEAGAVADLADEFHGHRR